MNYADNKLAAINQGNATRRRFGYFDNVQLVHDFKNDRGVDRYYGPMRRIVIRADHSSDEVRFFADVTLWGKSKKSAVTVELDVLQAFEVDPVNRADIDVTAAMLHCKRYKEIGWALFHWWSQYQEIAFQTMTWSPSMTFRVWAKERKSIHAQVRHLKSPRQRKGKMVTVPYQMLTYGMQKQHEAAVAELRDQLRQSQAHNVFRLYSPLSCTLHVKGRTGTSKGEFHP
ncbi:hypothetical protein HGK82_00760 [Ochrobactrum sp. MT180101]|nr:hypothetical protein HGK82_00760 [Ochrobactrum sp. MT180101]